MSASVKSRAERFVAMLEKRKDDRGVMADLKRGFSETTADRTWPYISRWGCDLVNNRQRIIYQTVAAAYAYCKIITLKGNLGATCRQIAAGDEKGDEGIKTFETRFRRLLTCSTLEELSVHLVGIIKTAASKNIPLNYTGLFEDLWWWSNNTKIKWAAEYWGARAEGQDEISDKNNS